MKYIKTFDTHSEYQTYSSSSEFITPNVSFCKDNTDEVHYNPYVEPYDKKYLTFEALEDGTFTFTIGANNYGVSLDITSVSYSLDNGSTWVTTQRDSSASTVITTPTVEAGSKVLWKGNATSYYSNNGSGIYSTFSSTGNFNVYGNISSLCYGDNFSEVSSCGIYGGMWKYCSTLISAENLILPSTTLTVSCYQYMFSGCTALTTAPVLPAITLAQSCYQQMFYGCTSLTTAPELPATTLTEYCYQSMFRDCTGLTTAPVLNATTLVRGCYSSMFYGCTSLATAPVLPATTLAEYCYQEMFHGCTSLATAPVLPATTLVSGCYNFMFYNCTALTTAPVLNATALAEYCYSSMFNGCTSLTTAPVLPATTLAVSCYDSMFYGCSSLNYIKAMFTTTPSSSYTYNWVNGVAASGTFVKNSAAQWNVTGYDGIPTGWTVQTASE